VINGKNVGIEETADWLRNQGWRGLTAMNKDEILQAIRKTAKTNGGKPLGRARFEAETGISQWDCGKYWTNWSDAVQDAGFEPNQMNVAFDDEFLVEKLVELTRQLQKVPVLGDLRIAKTNDPTFPARTVFNRLGSKRQRVEKVIAYCESRPDHDDVSSLWKRINVPQTTNDEEESAAEVQSVGYVYLVKHGSRREYKIGFTYDPIRRLGENRIAAPENLTHIFTIETDDPAGVENYWHRRFASKRIRKDAEWFVLNAEDVRAFKRWRKIY